MTRLSPGTVEVWRVRTTDVDARPLERLLSGAERARAARLSDPVQRARFVLTRATLRHLICAYQGGDPGALDLRYRSTGKPYLVCDGEPEALRFSVSHAGDLAILAFAVDRELGVDIERTRPPRHGRRIAARLFDADTQLLLQRLPAAERTLAFHHAWTQREAYVKAVGGTVFRTHDPLSLPWPRPRQAVQRVAGGGVWTIAALRPLEGYVGSLVVAGEADRIIERDHDGPPHQLSG